MLALKTYMPSCPSERDNQEIILLKYQIIWTFPQHIQSGIRILYGHSLDLSNRISIIIFQLFQTEAGSQ